MQMADGRAVGQSNASIVEPQPRIRIVRRAVCAAGACQQGLKTLARCAGPVAEDASRFEFMLAIQDPRQGLKRLRRLNQQFGYV